MAEKTAGSAIVVVVGSLNADLAVRTDAFPEPGQTVHGSKLTTSPGGKGANQAVAAALLGAKVTIIGAVGDDEHGDMLRKSLSRVGVDISQLRTSDQPTGTAIVVIDKSGENFIVLSPGANNQLQPSDLADNTNLLASAEVLCLCLEIPIETVTAAARTAHAGDTLVLLNLSPYAEVPDELLENTDIVIVNEHEAAQLLGSPVTDDWSATLQQLQTHNIRRAVITLGPEGAMVLDSTAATTVVKVPPVEVESVDTTGAGDAFAGALASRLAAGDTLSTAATFAARVGAFATAHPGTQTSYPTRNQLDDSELRDREEKPLSR